MVLGILIATVLIIFIAVWYKRQNLSKNSKNAIPDTIISENKSEFEIVHISDIHYIAPELSDSGKYFRKDPEKEPRMMQCICQITDSFILEMIEKKPDLVVISGDLTYNGEKISHKNLSKKLSMLKGKGIEVLVIPGNHDIDNKRAGKYINGEFEAVETVNAEEFTQIYKDFGYEKDDPRVLGRDKNSLSYMYMLGKKQCLLMIETSYGKNNNEVSSHTLRWIKKMLEIAESENMSVISVTHQSILVHNKMFISGYKLENSSDLVQLLSRYNVHLNLSGHIHMQNISENKGVYDASVGCIALYPNLYAVVNNHIGDYIEYRAESLDVSKWAKKYGWKDKELLDFKEFSKDKFENFAIRMFSGALQNIPVTLEEKKQMERFMIDTSIAYFSGSLDSHNDFNVENEIYKKWKKYCENTSEMTYLNSICSDSSKSNNKIRINLKS